jgi:hypothetical protein
MLCAAVNAVSAPTSRPERGHEQDQADDEEDVIDAGQDVLDAEREVRGQQRARGREPKRRVGSLHDAGDRAAVGELGPDERRGERAFQADDPDLLSRESTGAPRLPARDESAVGDFDVALAERRAGRGQLWVDGDAGFGERGLFPGEGVDVVGVFGDFEVGGADLVGVRGEGESRRRSVARLSG